MDYMLVCNFETDTTDRSPSVRHSTPHQPLLHLTDHRHYWQQTFTSVFLVIQGATSWLYMRSWMELGIITDFRDEFAKEVPACGCVHASCCALDTLARAHTFLLKLCEV